MNSAGLAERRDLQSSLHGAAPRMDPSFDNFLETDTEQ